MNIHWFFFRKFAIIRGKFTYASSGCMYVQSPSGSILKELLLTKKSRPLNKIWNLNMHSAAWNSFSQLDVLRCHPEASYKENTIWIWNRQSREARGNMRHVEEWSTKTYCLPNSMALVGFTWHKTILQDWGCCLVIIHLPSMC